MVLKMIAELEKQLLSLSSQHRTAKETVDVTLPLQVVFNNADRNVVKARLRYQGPECGSWLAMVVGLRSDILAPFARFENGRTGLYKPCDILGLVPALSLMVAHQNNGLAVSAVAKGVATHLVLVFEGQPDSKSDSLRLLTTSVWAFMKRWSDWTEVLLSTIRRDPSVAEWDFDWREFLAGESGFVNMPWFKPMTYSDRALALDRVVMTSKSLITSVLNQKQTEDAMIRGLVSWLDELTPVVEVVGGLEGAMEVESQSVV